jgi:heptose I phosphotransferase
MSELYLSATFRQAWQNQDPFEAVKQLKGKVYRQVKNRKTLAFNWQGRWYFIKIHQGIGWGEIIKNLISLRPPIFSATNEYRAIKRLTALQVATMEVAAYGKRGINPAKLESFIITKALTDTQSLEQLAAHWIDQPPTFSYKLALLKQVAWISRQLYLNGINHRDYYLCHFLLKSHDPANPLDFTLYLIDLHRAGIHVYKRQRWFIKDIAGLYFSAMNTSLTQRDYYRFMRLYFNKSLADTLKQDKKFWQRVNTRAFTLFDKVHKKASN